MPQSTPKPKFPFNPFAGKTTVRVDLKNRFFRRTDGEYKQFVPELVPKQSITNVQTYIFDCKATVQVKDCILIEEVRANPGDMLIIWSNGKHKVVPPEAQKWIVDLVPTPIRVSA
jgi:hypothetical protein